MGSLGGGSVDTEPTQVEREGARRAAALWNDFVDRFAPVQDKLIERIRVTEDARSGGRAEAVAAAGRRFLPSALQGRNAAGGVAASSGANVRDVIAENSARRRGLSAGVASVEPRLVDRELRGRLSVAASGRGLRDQASLALRRRARDRTVAEINEAFNDLETKQSFISAASTGLGAFAGTKALFGSGSSGSSGGGGST